MLLQPLFLLAWAWMSTAMMVSVLAVCSWHRRRMQRRREGLLCLAFLFLMPHHHHHVLSDSSSFPLPVSQFLFLLHGSVRIICAIVAIACFVLN
jgi:uncharacterized membrane protein